MKKQLQWAVVLVAAVSAMNANSATSSRARRQASGCFWWAGECDGESTTHPPAQPTPESNPVEIRDGGHQHDQHQNQHLQEPQPQHQAQQHQGPQHHPHTDYQEYSSCDKNRGVCVPYYLCRENSIITDGAGIIDIRIGGQNDTKTRSSSECPSYLDVCCGSPLPPTTPTPPPTPYQSKCGTRNYQGIDIRIQGFKENQAQYAEFPWMAAILRNELVEGSVHHFYVCGGSLIHPQLVLTAAHCVAKLGADQLTVRLGEWDTQRNYEPYEHQDKKVASVTLHPYYNRFGALTNDFALLYLDTPAELTYNVDTLCLGSYFDYNQCLVTGWGKDKFGKEGVYQNVLKKIDLPLWDDGKCQEALRTTRLGRFFNLHSSFVCAGGEAGKDSCSGDGGSPLVCQDPNNGKYVQVGMVAWGIGCGTPGIPGVYVDVPFGYDWIIKIANNLLHNTHGYNSAYWNYNN